MSTQSRPYIPAPYLLKGSFLKAQQLFDLFEDFRATLEHASSAPELVFERLVGNLNSAFTEVLDLERERHGIALEEVKSLLADRLPKEGRAAGEHRTAVSTTTSNNLAIGTFHTSEVRSWDQQKTKTLKTVYCDKLFYTPLNIPVGLTELHLSVKAGGINVEVSTNNLRKGSFDLCVGTRTSDALVHGAGCTWLEMEPNDLDFQCGHFSTAQDHPPTEPQLETVYQVTFPREFSTPPQVIVWINSFWFNSKNDRRLSTYATDITTTGFTLHVDSWSYSVLYSAGVSWVACTSCKTKVFSGSFATSDLRSGYHQFNNSGYVRFGSGIFTKPPRVITAISRFDVGSEYDLRFSIKTSGITASGMTWDINTWSDTLLYSAGASFIAFDYI